MNRNEIGHRCNRVTQGWGERSGGSRTLDMITATLEWFPWSSEVTRPSLHVTKNHMVNKPTLGDELWAPLRSLEWDRALPVTVSVLKGGGIWDCHSQHWCREAVYWRWAPFASLWVKERPQDTLVLTSGSTPHHHALAGSTLSPEHPPRQGRKSEEMGGTIWWDVRGGSWWRSRRVPGQALLGIVEVAVTQEHLLPRSEGRHSKVGAAGTAESIAQVALLREETITH